MSNQIEETKSVNDVSKSVNEVRRKPVVIDIGGKQRALKYDMNAFAEIEERYGSIDAAFGSLEKGKISDLRTLLWAGLIHEHAVIDEETGEVEKYDITVYQVGQWIDNIGMLATIAEKLSEAIMKDMPTVDPKADNSKN